MKELFKKLKGNKKSIVLTTVTILVAFLYGFGFYETNKDKPTEEVINNAVEEVKDYIENSSTTEIYGGSMQLQKIQQIRKLRQTQQMQWIQKIHQ